MAPKTLDDFSKRNATEKKPETATEKKLVEEMAKAASEAVQEAFEGEKTSTSTEGEQKPEETKVEISGGVKGTETSKEESSVETQQSEPKVNDLCEELFKDSENIQDSKAKIIADKIVNDCRTTANSISELQKGTKILNQEAELYNKNAETIEKYTSMIRNFSGKAKNVHQQYLVPEANKVIDDYKKAESNYVNALTNYGEKEREKEKAIGDLENISKEFEKTRNEVHQQYIKNIRLNEIPEEIKKLLAKYAVRLSEKEEAEMVAELLDYSPEKLEKAIEAAELLGYEDRKLLPIKAAYILLKGGPSMSKEKYRNLCKKLKVSAKAMKEYLDDIYMAPPAIEGAEIRRKLRKYIYG